jgi:hypothetical protein
MSVRLLPLVLFLVASAGRAEGHEFTQRGTLAVAGGPARAAELSVACAPQPNGGALSIELGVPEANTRRDFDYDDFEGPDAAAADQALSELVWTGATGRVAIRHAAAGWYAPEPPGSFRFGIEQPSHRRAEPARLLAAIRDGAGTLVWTQTALADPQRRLVATFALDAAAVARLHDTVAQCLPQNLPMRPRSP